MIHYHGTPLTPLIQLYKMAGKNFCVSFFRPDNVDICMKIGQSIMFDNGAFSAFSKNIKIDFKEYYKWLEDKIGHPHWAVIPDFIDGSVKQQKKLLKDFPYPKEISAPVFHIHLPLDYLDFLTDNYPKICFGSSGEFWKIGSDLWISRIDKLFNHLSKKHRYLPHIHMMRGLSLSGTMYPFASADSTNVARNFKDKNKCPELMARKIDSMQNPTSWKIIETQTKMFL